MSEINADEIFAGLYDQIFLQDVKNIYDSGKIASLTKKILESNVTAEEKKYFLRLKNQYYKVKNIKNYELLQKKLYNDKSRYEIISFELARILNMNNLPMKVSEQVSDIEKLLAIYKDSKLTDELYEKIVTLIIKIEMSLGMKIGLFSELCTLFESELKRIDKELVVDTVVYSKKK